jgi:imidazoleglycerol-phosphate dehydratase
MATLARYSRLDLTLQASGDLKHHLIEDVGIAFGAAVADFVPATCAGYGQRVVPMDVALGEGSVDLGGRGYYRGPIPSSLYDHWFRSFADHAHATVHTRVLRGSDRHHVVEAAFKALGLALHDALIDTGTVFSTKGAIRW